MANILRIKRGTGTPSGLVAGELAYSNDQNLLYIGHPSNIKHVQVLFFCCVTQGAQHIYLVFIKYGNVIRVSLTNEF